MFCPTCRSEFRPGIATCADCGVALVDRLPDSGHEGLGDLVPLRRVWQPDLLPVLMSVLEGEGIPYVVQGEHSLNTVGFAQALRHADPESVFWTILVPETRLARAKEVLTAEVVEGESSVGLATSAPSARESGTAGFVRSIGWFALFSALVAAVSGFLLLSPGELSNTQARAIVFAAMVVLGFLAGLNSANFFAIVCSAPTGLFLAVAWAEGKRSDADQRILETADLLAWGPEIAKLSLVFFVAAFVARRGLKRRPVRVAA